MMGRDVGKGVVWGMLDVGGVRSEEVGGVWRMLEGKCGEEEGRDVMVVGSLSWDWKGNDGEM